MFSGRVSEIEIIEKCLFQTKNGNPQNFLIQGERGIGKSSLILYARYLATGKLSNTYNFATIKIELEPHYRFLDIVGKLVAEAKTELSSNDKLETVKKWIDENISQLQSSYLSLKKTDVPDNMLISNLANTFKKISEIKEIDGVLVLIDEADKPGSQSELGSFFKLLTERLVTINCNNVCLGISGLSETIDKLRKSHESSLRIFHILNLETLNNEESKNVIDVGLNEANEKNDVKTDMSEENRKFIIELSEGYPYFLQQFCYNSFEADVDNIIDEDDIKKGIYDENTGALKQLGEKLFNNMFYNKIESDDYRKVLQYMAIQNNKWIKRADIMKHSG